MSKLIVFTLKSTLRNVVFLTLCKFLILTLRNGIASIAVRDCLIFTLRNVCNPISFLFLLLLLLFSLPQLIPLCLLPADLLALNPAPLVNKTTHRPRLSRNARWYWPGGVYLCAELGPRFGMFPLRGRQEGLSIPSYLGKMLHRLVISRSSQVLVNTRIPLLNR
jgi:hypothetical protein